MIYLILNIIHTHKVNMMHTLQKIYSLLADDKRYYICLIAFP